MAKQESGTLLLGLLKINVIRGINLVAKDGRTSDPYLMATMGSQTLKTRHVKNDCNPEWNDQLTLAVYDPDVPVILTVYDKDTFTRDDKMGEATIDIKPYLECLKTDLRNLPTGAVVSKIYPNSQNSLADVSQIVWKDGKLVQNMTLKLKNVVTGQIEIHIEWVNLPSSSGI